MTIAFEMRKQTVDVAKLLPTKVIKEHTNIRRFKAIVDSLPEARLEENAAGECARRIFHRLANHPDVMQKQHPMPRALTSGPQIRDKTIPLHVSFTVSVKLSER